VARATTDGRPQKSEAQIIAEAQRRAGIMAFGGRADSGGVAGALSGIAGSGVQGGGMGAAEMPQGADSGQGGGRTTLDNLRRTSEITRVSGRSIGNRDMLILAGTFIPCVLQTAMDSSQPGYASCVIPRDIYSDNGRVVLLEKGTRVLGEYQAGISRGRYRLFVMWSRAVTPRGVAIDVGSPASDALGRAGVAGGVENYFWERFGAALLFSAIDDGMDVLAESVSDAQETARAPSRAADTILRDTMQIQPVLKVNQGAEVGIMVARDFDFSDVYGLQMRR
jgi:type IV secretion system protein VirB10